MAQLQEGIRQVNAGLYDESLKREELSGMGCTLVAAVIEDGKILLAILETAVFTGSMEAGSARLQRIIPMRRKW